MPKIVSPEDRTLAQHLYSQGLSSREISERLSGRLSASWISAHSRDEGWLRGVLPPDVLAAGTEQVYEPANADPETKNANTEKLEAASRRRFAQRKVEMADRMASKVDVLLDQMFGQHVVKEIKLVGMGGGIQEVKLVEVQLNEPSPADKKHLATTMAILVDKASLLMGDATSRVETAKLRPEEVTDRLKHYRNEVAERAAQKAAQAQQPPQEAAG